MMKSAVKSLVYRSGDVQRIQVVTLSSFDGLDFFSPSSENKESRLAAFEGFVRIYRQFLVPAAPWAFGQIGLFCLPEQSSYGAMIRAGAKLRSGMSIRNGKAHFKDDEARALWERLERAGCTAIVAGRLPVTKIIPVGARPGLLSEAEPEAVLKVNAHFFIMDPFDCASPYDIVGMPFGLCVQNGLVLSPPLYGRECFLVTNGGEVRIEENLPVDDLRIEIAGETFLAGDNAVLYQRPQTKKTPRFDGYEYVIIGAKVIAVHHGGNCMVPASGFVLRPTGKEPPVIRAGEVVRYGGMEDIRFGLQVGNSLVKNGKVTEKFESPFYNVRQLGTTAFPPSLYPLDFEKARAARMAIGVSKDGQPMLIWAEGAPKAGYRQGVDSCGASLAEFGTICLNEGMENAVNLDGGGSAQMLVFGERMLKISDRREDGSESERAVPLGMIIHSMGSGHPGGDVIC